VNVCRPAGEISYLVFGGLDRELPDADDLGRSGCGHKLPGFLVVRLTASAEHPPPGEPCIDISSRSESGIFLALMDGCPSRSARHVRDKPVGSLRRQRSDLLVSLSIRVPEDGRG